VARYRFVTQMRFGAPIDAVYRSITEPESWLDRWADTVTVERTSAGDDDGVGASFDAAVRAPIGYTLAARIETSAADRPRHLRMRATGDLEGEGRWHLRVHPSGGTEVHFRWDVRTTETWMNLLTPVARPLFEWSHGVVMRHAAEAAAASLGTPLVAFRSAPEVSRRGRRVALLVGAATAVVLFASQRLTGSRE
jgi:hypothetical protein